MPNPNSRATLATRKQASRPIADAVRTNAAAVHFHEPVSSLDRQARRRAGKVHKREQYGTYGGQPSPAVIDEQRMQFLKRIHFGQRPGRKIGHDDDWHDDLVCRQAEDKRHQNNTVEPEPPRNRVEKGRAVRQNAHIAYVNIC